ncbi:MAG TPA: hypothetical protein VKT33_12675 [Candidatus Angelobacter sp.]|nr:hypothetical protein [Candidatus Angelobacter sp.]
MSYVGKGLRIAAMLAGLAAIVISPGTKGFAQGGIQHCEQFSGADAGAKIINCMAALPPGGGIADARGFGASIQSIGAASCPLNIGSATKQVTLLVDPATRFNVDCTGGVAAIRIFNASVLDCGNGATLNGGGGGGFYLAAGANVSNMVANGSQDGTQEYMKLSGCYFQGNQAATLTDALAHFKLLNAGTMISNNTFTVAMAGTGVIIEAANAFPWTNNWVNGTAGVPNIAVQPMIINGNTVNFTILAGAIEHSCQGKPLLSIDGTTGVNGGSSNFIRGVSIFGTHFETDCGSNGIEATNIKGLHIHDAHLQICCGHTVTGRDFVLLSEAQDGMTDSVLLTNLDNFGIYTNTVNDTTASGIGPITDQTLPVFIHSNTPPRMVFNVPVKAGSSPRAGGTANTNTYSARGNVGRTVHHDRKGEHNRLGQELEFGIANDDKWGVDSGGNLLALVDGGPSIGRYGNNRPNNIFVRNSIAIRGGEALTTSAQSGTGKLCMTTGCAMTTPNIGAASGKSLTVAGAAGLRTKPAPFASLAECAAGKEGSLVAVSDSTTNAWGAAISGGGSHHVLAYCDGTNWTVAAK